MTKEFQHYTDKFDLTEPWVAKHKYSMNSADTQLKIKKSNKMNPRFQSGYTHKTKWSYKVYAFDTFYYISTKD